MHILGYYGIGGLIVLILDIWAIISIINSSDDMLSKVIWTLVVLVFPLLGFILWFFFGPKSA
jgi:hypothetical protein